LINPVPISNLAEVKSKFIGKNDSAMETYFINFLERYVYPKIEELINRNIKKALKEQLPSKNDLENEFLNSYESAKFLGESKASLYRRIHNREINRYGTPRKIFCKKSELITIKYQLRRKSQNAISEEADEMLNKKRKK